MLLTATADCAQYAPMLTETDWTLIRKAAATLGISRNTAKSWGQKGRRIPAERVPGLAKASGLPKWKMRPDVYDPPRRGNAA